MLKIRNNRIGGSLFHYAHFICDCLFPEVVNKVHLQYNEVIREQSISQTLGNFGKLYTEIMRIKNTEILADEYENLNHIRFLSHETKEKYCERKYFDEFRNYIFSRYNINKDTYNPLYPEVILVKRGERIPLISNEFLAVINHNFSTGRERREINNIEEIEDYLKKKYGNQFKALYFENISFVEQVKYFNNAKLIVCAHGAVMSNMFFCKEGTRIVEVTCGATYPFFDVLSKLLKLDHIKCEKNNTHSIIRCL